MDSKDLLFLREKIETTKTNRISKAKQYVFKKIKKSTNYGTKSVYISTKMLTKWFGLTEHDARAIFDEYRDGGWAIANYTRSFSGSYSGYLVSITEKVYEHLPPKPSDAELLKNAIEEIKRLKNEISILPGGDEYLAAQARFNQNIDSTGCSA